MEHPMALDIMEELRAIAERSGQPLVTVLPVPDPWESLDEEALPDLDEEALAFRAFIQGGEEGVVFDVMDNDHGLM